MKIALLSDPHTKHDGLIVPDADMVICAGDFSNYGNEKEALHFSYWFKNLPHQHKILIAGNHDKFAEWQYSSLRQMLGEGVIYLDNQGVEIEGHVIWGSPWTPTFGSYWAFNADRGAEIKRHWDKIPEETSILVTHGPPKGILDTAFDYEGNMRHVGCEELLKRLHKLKELKLHVFGHIHAGFGISQAAPYGISVNAAVTDFNDEGYYVARQPIVLDI